MWETIRGYLTFTRKERFGVLFLLLIICVLFVLPYFFRRPVGEEDPAAFEKMKESIRKFEMKDSGTTSFKSVASAPDALKPVAAHLRPQVFYFDPNQIRLADWKRLGLSQRLAETITHYIDKGGRFRKPEDLKKIYGLSDADYQRLTPFIQFDKKWQKPDPLNDHRNWRSDSESDGYPSGHFTIKHKSLTPVEINRADTADWSRLPGIGGKLAARIIHFREKLGGFYEIQQVAETFGLPDTVFQKIRPALRLDEVKLLQIDLNHATKEALQAHPYIRWQIAKEIVEYRFQHGAFHTVDQLQMLAQVDSSKFKKIRPYVFVKP